MRPITKPHQALAIVLIAITVLIGGCGGSAPPAVPAAAAPAANAASAPLKLPVDIDAATANEIRDRDDVLVLDVREDWEYDAGHVPGASWIPLGQLADRLDEIPQDKTVVAVCRSGNRSGQATQILRQEGFDAHNMQGGMISWEQAGYEIEK